ncbi:MAG TPA: hypothetical protein VG871_23515 [Vicinamibacterales bacterium]|nr:hypothetical protein [Vicinamibacterales bacterium]
MRRFTVVLCALIVGVLSSRVAAAQTLQLPSFAPTGTPAPATAATPDEGVGQFRPRPVNNGLPRFGIGVKAGTLGIGLQVGTALASRVNLRGGANFFNYNDTLNDDGIDYHGTLQLRSVEAKLDLFVIGGFRITPGLLLYNDNSVSATAAVPDSKTFTLNGVTYSSLASDPIHGTAGVTFNKFAPTIGIGFGNLLPRSGRHFSVSTDLGIAFSGAPQFALALAGTGCARGVCQPINTLAAADIESQRAKIQNDLNPFRYYPEASIMFGWSF